MPDKKTILKMYNDWGSKYDDLIYGIHRSHHGVDVAKLLGVKSSDVVVELGCGTGRILLDLLKKTKKVTGVDFSKEMLKEAEKKCNAKLFLSDITKTSFKNNYFDKAISILVADHIPEISKLYKEAYRILKKGGMFLIDDFSPFLQTGVLDYARTDSKWVDYVRPKAHKLFEFRSLEEHVDIAQKVGFKIEKILPVKIGPAIKQLFSPYSYKEYKGNYYAYFLLLKK